MSSGRHGYLKLAIALLGAWTFLSAPIAQSSAVATAQEAGPKLNMDGQIVQLSLGDYVDGLSQEVAGLTLTISPNNYVTPDDQGLFRAEFRISAPGFMPITFRFPLEEGTSFDDTGDYRIGIGKLTRGDPLPSLIIMQHSGGAHCCWKMKVVQPQGDGFVLTEMNSWDSVAFAYWWQNSDYKAPLRFPIDETGDGIVDFVMKDDRFNYAYAGYADSNPPPLILNVVDGKRVDVSRLAAFRKLFADFGNEAKQGCDNGSSGDDFANAHACLVYAASAARLGKAEYATATSIITRIGARAALPFADPCEPRVSGKCESQEWKRLPKLEDSIDRQLREWGYFDVPDAADRFLVP